MSGRPVRPSPVDLRDLADRCAEEATTEPVMFVRSIVEARELRTDAAPHDQAVTTLEAVSHAAVATTPSTRSAKPRRDFLVRDLALKLCGSHAHSGRPDQHALYGGKGCGLSSILELALNSTFLSPCTVSVCAISDPITPSTKATSASVVQPGRWINSINSSSCSPLDKSWSAERNSLIFGSRSSA
jgi:hypothetical protein